MYNIHVIYWLTSHLSFQEISAVQTEDEITESTCKQSPKSSEELKNLSKLFVEIIQAADLGTSMEGGTRVCLQFQVS